MKNLVLLLLLYTGIANAQIVNIPDANFKARLLAADVTNEIAINFGGVYFKIDANNDGEIQVAEALEVQVLYVSGYTAPKISDITGIQEFVNLITFHCQFNLITTLNLNSNTAIVNLNCSSNQLTNLDVSNNSALVILDCSDNQIINLDLGSITTLSVLNCRANQITSLSLINNTVLASLDCGENQLTNLDVSNNSLLTFFLCNPNQLTSLDVSNNLALTTFFCSGNLLTSLNVSNNTLLTNLVLADNLITSLNVSTNLALNVLDCSNNQISNIDVSTNLALLGLSCNSNQLTSLDLSSNIALTGLNCDNNQLTSLDVSNNVALMSLYCGGNLLTSLDITGLTNLQNLNFSVNQITNFTFPTPLTLANFYCASNNLSQIDVSKITCDNYDFSNNLNLTYINMKNGHQDGCVVLLQIGLDYICSRFLDLPNLQFICVDEGESVGWTIPSNISKSSYCTFTPGGQFNTITGSTTLDSNLNGCDLTDPVISNIKIGITDITNSGSSYSNNLGVYNFYSTELSQNIFPILENPTYFTANPTVVVVNFLEETFGQESNQNFCISPNGIHPDLEVVLAPINPARPGFDATYELVYKNKGNQTLSGAVNLVFDDFLTDFVSAIPAADNLAVNSLTWNFTNLMPFESRSIAVTLNVNSPVETPAVNIGDVLNFTTSITPIAGDELPADNTFTYNQTVVGSFDPNDITCLEGNSVAPSEIGKYLHYVINFENTGNFPAENIVVKTIVDTSKFDINSLQLLNTSNPVDARITGNVVEFIFEDIQLAGPGGHGHVLLKIKSKITLVTGDTVAKSAGIYFDYNAPVDTGMATTVFQSLSNTIFDKDDSINVSPNPTNGNVNVNSNFNIKSIELYDVQGRVLQTILNATILDISEKANGIYFLKITTEKGSKIEKVIKE